ncbi:Alcohol dehydrogenase, zinc-binding domain protein [Syntrophobacter sp. SbD1]|nr:Alcohol dehydrogenase, zinc-binding domain protein [Syntrophobacter sp. SbD1]
MKAQSMPAVIVRDGEKRGEWNALSLEMVEVPALKEGEALVQVEACSVNRADLLQRRGLYPPPPGASRVLGLDFAGFVVKAPPASAVKESDRVFGIVAGGGYGRYLAARAQHLVPIPENLSFTEAAATAEVFFTAYYNLFVQAGIKAADTVLLHGGGSGVGTAAIQLCSSTGAAVIITAGSEDKIKRALDLGASAGINYKQEDFAGRVLAITRGEGVDIVLDSIGAPYLHGHMEVLKTKGRLVIIGLMGGSAGEINLVPLLTKRIKIIGSVLRSQSKEEKTEITGGFIETVVPLLRSGRVKPIIDRIFPISKVEDAHRYLREGAHFGKIVLTWEQL